LEKIELGLKFLQTPENAQNHQRNAWKGLEKKGLELEKFGKNRR